MRTILQALVALVFMSGCTNPDGSMNTLGTLGVVAGVAALGVLAATALDDDEPDYSSSSHGGSHSGYRTASGYGDSERRLSQTEKSRILRTGCQKRYGGPHGPGARDYGKCMDGEREAGWKDGCAQVFGSDTRRRRACEAEF